MDRFAETGLFLSSVPETELFLSSVPEPELFLSSVPEPKLPASGGLGQPLADFLQRGLSAPGAMKGTRSGLTSPVPLLKDGRCDLPADHEETMCIEWHSCGCFIPEDAKSTSGLIAARGGVDASVLGQRFQDAGRHGLAW